MTSCSGGCAGRRARLERPKCSCGRADAHDRVLGPRNGHTAIHPLDDHPMPQHAYPLALHEFEDGVFVIAAENRDLVGAELVAVDGVDITDVLRAVTPLVAHDNVWTIRARRPVFVVRGSVLRGLGVVEDDSRATFRLRRPNASTVDVELDAVAAADYRDGLGSGDWFPDFTRVSYLRRRNEWHWVEPTRTTASSTSATT